MENTMGNKVHTLKFTRSDLIQALRREGIKQGEWDAKAFEEALKLKSITAAVNHVLDHNM